MLPPSIYLFKVYSRNIRKWCELCSKWTMKTPERLYWGRSGFFIVKFEDIRHLHCVKSVQIHIQSEYRKIRTRNNFVFGHFTQCFFWCLYCQIWLSTCFLGYFFEHISLGTRCGKFLLQIFSCIFLACSFSMFTLLMMLLLVAILR